MDVKNGRAAVLFPHGVLFRQEEKDLRAKLVNSGILEAVIGLGAGLFYNSPMEAVVLILRNGRSEDQRSKTIFINAIDLVTRERSVSYLSSPHQDAILSAYKNFKDKSGFASLRSTDEIKAKNYSLAIPLYVERLANNTEDDDISIQTSFTDWIMSAKSSKTSLDSLLSILPQEELP
jgi:type I restriction enzyme M protein